MVEGVSRQDPASLLDLQLRSPQGDLISVSAIASLQWSTAPHLLGRFQQKNAFRIYGGVLPGTTKEQGLAALEAAAADLLPAGYSLDYAPVNPGKYGRRATPSSVFWQLRCYLFIRGYPLNVSAPCI